MKNHKLINKDIKVVNLEILKVKTWFCDEDLSSLDSINLETHKGKYMDDNGTYLGNIYGIYKECITNISIDIYDIK